MTCHALGINGSVQVEKLYESHLVLKEVVLKAQQVVLTKQVP